MAHQPQQSDAAPAVGLQWQRFDQQPYEAVYALQKQLVTERLQDHIPDTLLLGEHLHVITLGRGTHPENLLHVGNIPVVEIERGGDVTYHGPGQLVGYPILKLTPPEQDLHRYLRNLEEVLIQVLAANNIEGHRRKGWTGVWVADQKIASIGVAVKKWVTYHGFALNVTTDLSYYRAINPCGLNSTVMTSLAALLGPACPDIDQVRAQTLTTLSEVFHRPHLPSPLEGEGGAVGEV